MPAIPRGRRIAIVGSGVSGLTAAWLLRDRHDITVFEASRRLGGHSRTVDASWNDERHAVDTGFMLYNERSYPLFARLLRRLGVETRASPLTFSIQIARSGLEYSTASLRGLLAQPGNLLRPSFLRMLLDLRRFARESESAPGGRGLADDPAADPEPTLGEYLAARRYSAPFIHHCIVPLGSALWSAVPRRLLDTPARPFVAFLREHGFISPGGRPGWRSIQGGSRLYVEALAAPFRDRVRLATPVREVRRHEGGVAIGTDAGTETFDAVVLAAHPDQALALIADPSPVERDILGAFPSQTNDAALHTDARLLPRRRSAWAAWNCHAPEGDGAPARVTCLMNLVHGLPTATPFCVTLNRTLAVDSERLLDTFAFGHPVFTEKAPAAQRHLAGLNGHNRTYYCGAWRGDGFHEAGVASAAEVGRLLGAEFPA